MQLGVTSTVKRSNQEPQILFSEQPSSGNHVAYAGNTKRVSLPTIVLASSGSNRDSLHCSHRAARLFPLGEQEDQVGNLCVVFGSSMFSFPAASPFANLTNLHCNHTGKMS